MSAALPYLYLAAAIVLEVIATTALKASDTFTRPGPSAVTIGGYAAAFVLLSLSLRTIPTGIAYAIWAGVGIVLIAAVGWIWFGQPLDGPAIIGIGLIILGVVVVNVFSRTIGH
jgi:small multidrug resistance pump